MGICRADQYETTSDKAIGHEGALCVLVSERPPNITIQRGWLHRLQAVLGTAEVKHGMLALRTLN